MNDVLNGKTLAVIMPVKNRLTLTRQTIESLLSSTSLPFTLVIVADACTEETNHYLLSLPSTLDRECIVDVLSEPAGPGKARNIGMSHAQGADYYYHTDCDMYILPGAIEKLICAYQTFPEIGVLGGRKHPHHGVFGSLEQNGHRVLVSDQQVGMSLFFSKDVWEKIGYFKENAPTPKEMGVEDTHFCNMVKEQGYKVGSVDPAVVLHCGIKNSFGIDTQGASEELQQPFPEGCLYGIYE